MGTSNRAELEEFDGLPEGLRDPFAIAGLCDYVSCPAKMLCHSLSERVSQERHEHCEPSNGRTKDSPPGGVSLPQLCLRCKGAKRTFGPVLSLEGGTLPGPPSLAGEESGRTIDSEDGGGGGGAATPGSSLRSAGRSLSDGSLYADSPSGSGRTPDPALPNPGNADVKGAAQDRSDGGQQASDGKEHGGCPRGDRWHNAAAASAAAVRAKEAAAAPLGAAQSQRARARWRQIRRTLAFARNISGGKLFRGVTHGAADLLHAGPAPGGAGPGAASAAPPGGKVAAAAAGKEPVNMPPKGQAAFDQLVVFQHSKWHFLQDLYVSSFKVPLLYFVLAMLATPFLLSLLFAPLYLADVAGFDFGRLEASHFRVMVPPRGEEGGGGGGGGGMCGAAAPGGGLAAALWSFADCMNVAAVLGDVYLYSLSVTTMIGGHADLGSRYLLCVANLHMLMTQFLFVFISGAVFSRMSRPAHPVRVANKVIMHENDTMASPNGIREQQRRTLTTRLVLTGPPPCELVDVKLRLTFRCYITFPTGGFFYSISDLQLVRSEASHLRWGQTVRHIIDEDSPLFEHTRDTLQAGDASFSLTVLGTERSSMQPIFHTQEYFVHDGDVLWNVDFQDMVSFTAKGERVLDHASVDRVKVFKGGAMAVQAINRLSHLAQRQAKPVPERQVAGRDRQLGGGGSAAAGKVPSARF